MFLLVASRLDCAQSPLMQQLSTHASTIGCADAGANGCLNFAVPHERALSYVVILSATPGGQAQYSSYCRVIRVDEADPRRPGAGTVVSAVSDSRATVRASTRLWSP